ncbi:hypothetical protein WJX79_002169 [Trebouxia sp. C0005]
MTQVPSAGILTNGTAYLFYKCYHDETIQRGVFTSFYCDYDYDYAEYAPALWQKGNNTLRQLANFSEPHYLACAEGHIDDIQARADRTGSFPVVDVCQEQTAGMKYTAAQEDTVQVSAAGYDNPAGQQPAGGLGQALGGLELPTEEEASHAESSGAITCGTLLLYILYFLPVFFVNRQASLSVCQVSRAIRCLARVLSMARFASEAELETFLGRPDPDYAGVASAIHAKDIKARAGPQGSANLSRALFTEMLKNGTISHPHAEVLDTVERYYTHRMMACSSVQMAEEIYRAAQSMPGASTTKYFLAQHGLQINGPFFRAPDTGPVTLLRARNANYEQKMIKMLPNLPSNQLLGGSEAMACRAILPSAERLDIPIIRGTVIEVIVPPEHHTLTGHYPGLLLSMFMLRALYTWMSRQKISLLAVMGIGGWETLDQQ